MLVREQQGLVEFVVQDSRSISVLLLQAALLLLSGVLYLGKVDARACVGVALLPLLLRSKTQESAMVVEEMGLQLVRRGRIRFKDDQDQFIPVYMVLNVVINEVFVGFKVVHMLQVIVKDRKDLVLVFDRLNPRLHDLETAWRGIQRVLRN